ncbi:MAG: SRPBCC family protein [Micromonosporaceae bacterium]
MTDIVGQLNAVHREVGQREVRGSDGRTVVLRRDYDAPIEDVWDAITNAERIGRWFLPVTGDLRLGGTYQLKDNAGGEILRCEPPRLLGVSWIFGEPTDPAAVSEVEVRLSAEDGRTRLVLEHAAMVDARWAEFGPGAVGVGWDMAVLGLGLHLQGVSIEDPGAWVQSEEARRFMTGSSVAWGEALRPSGGTDAEVATAVENTTRAYVPPA